MEYIFNYSEVKQLTTDQLHQCETTMNSMLIHIESDYYQRRVNLVTFSKTDPNSNMFAKTETSINACPFCFTRFAQYAEYECFECKARTLEPEDYKNSQWVCDNCGSLSARYGPINTIIEFPPGNNPRITIPWEVWENMKKIRDGDDEFMKCGICGQDANHCDGVE